LSIAFSGKVWVSSAEGYSADTVALRNNHVLDFEKPIVELEERIAQLADATSERDLETLAQLRRDLEELKREVFSKLTPWETVQVARHPERPQSTDFIRHMVEGFVELHGDRGFSDDRAVVTGLGRIGGRPVLIVGHRKGKTTRERVTCYFGCAHPEGYRKALTKMRLAEKFGLPVVSLIDTSGAYAGIGAEERGQAQAIATNLFEMSRLRVPIYCAVIGEGGSGGALGIGVGDHLAMLEHSYYSVIAPEGFSAILWRDSDHAPEAAGVLRITPPDLVGMGIVDEVVPEPSGGAHRDPRAAADLLKEAICRKLAELERVPVKELLARRYDKHRRIGCIIEGDGATTG
jgi:acetyl-CoA carboxylase carboxyl transferase subunit alpha